MKYPPEEVERAMTRAQEIVDEALYASTATTGGDQWLEGLVVKIGYELLKWKNGDDTHGTTD